MTRQEALDYIEEFGGRLTTSGMNNWQVESEEFDSIRNHIIDTRYVEYNAYQCYQR